MKHWFVGWDVRDELAAKVAARSMYAYHNGGIMVHFLKDHLLRRYGFYWRGYEVRPNGQMIDARDGKPFSTQFSFSRFCVPELARRMGIHDPVLFTDPDVMYRANIQELFDLWDDEYAVMCVQHDHRPKEETKMDGVEQTKYFRKNWSSVMLIHPDRTEDCNLHKVNNQTGSQLHALLWAGDDHDIGSLPKEWNHLVGYDEPDENAKLVHFTLGTPDMPGRDGSEFSKEWWGYVQPNDLDSELPFVDQTQEVNAKLQGTGGL